MPNVLIRDLPEDTVSRIKDLAADAGQSMQTFLKRLLINEVGQQSESEGSGK